MRLYIYIVVQDEGHSKEETLHEIPSPINKYMYMYTVFKCTQCMHTHINYVYCAISQTNKQIIGDLGYAHGEFSRSRSNMILPNPLFCSDS